MKMTSEEVEIARALLKLPAFQWRHGMVAARDCHPRFRDYLRREITFIQKRDLEFISEDCIPDLAMPSTTGALLGLIRELHHDRDLHPVLRDGAWHWHDGRGLPCGWTSAGSYVQALYNGLSASERACA